MVKLYKLKSDKETLPTIKHLIRQGEENEHYSARLEDINYGRIEGKLVFNGHNVDIFIWDYHTDIPCWKLFGEFDTFDNAESALIEEFNIRDEVEYV